MQTELICGAVAICAGIVWALGEIWVWMDAVESWRIEPRSVVLAEEQVAADEAVWVHPSLPPRWPLE